ncbi:hypothetical protein [Parabacteroides sp.]
MKKILKLINIFIATIALYACSTEQAIDDIVVQQATKGLMFVRIVEDGAEVDDYIHTARFIVFNNASSFPSIDINEFVTLDRKDAQTFEIYLKVRCNPDKMLIVILNEPESLTGFLESVTSPSDLNTVKFQMAEVFNNNHTATRSRGIPMTGMAHNISITESHASEINAFMQYVTVKRAVARVEVWLKTEPYFQASVTSDTQITLLHSHNEGYLMDPETAPAFGNIQTVNQPDESVVWKHTGNDVRIENIAKLFCAFYTPERTCSAENDADKLVLKIDKIQTADGERNAVATLALFAERDIWPPIYQEIREIKRNNVYTTIGNIHKQKVDFQLVITPWKGIREDVVIDPQYYLRVSSDYLVLPDRWNTGRIVVETNYDQRNNWIYPAGIRIGETRYYTKNGDEVTDINSNLYGWLGVAADNNPGYNQRFVYCSVLHNLQNSQDRGCYATVEVGAGNLVKLIKIYR